MNYWIATVIVLIAAFSLLIYYMAWNDICWTFVEEGEIVVVMVGKKAYKYLANVVDYGINRKTGEVKECKDIGILPPDEQKRYHATTIGHWIEETFGIYWMGIWPMWSRYNYDFSWLKYAMNMDKPGNQKYEIIPRSDIVDSLYFRFAYAIVAEAVETKGKIPVNIQCVVTTQIIDAQRALFKSANWLGQLTAAVQSAIRDYVGNVEIEQLTTNKNEGEVTQEGVEEKADKHDRFADYIFNLNKKKTDDGKSVNKSISELLGVEIVAVNFLGYEITGGDSKDRLGAATTALYEAQQKALAIEREGKANARVILMEGLAKARAEKRLVEAQSSTIDGPRLAFAHAIANHEGTLVIGEGASVLVGDGPKIIKPEQK